MYQAAYAGYDSLTGYYDFLYRSYDPALGQFFAVDPMAGTQTGYSPYHANYNNPVMYVDPLGLRPEDFPEQWPRVDGFGGFGGGAEPNMSSWVSAGLGSSFSGHGYGADYSTYVESDRERLISMLVNAWGGTAEDSYRGFSISGGSIGLSSAVYTITDYYTNGIIDEEHYISTSVEFEHPALGFTGADVMVSSPYGEVDQQNWTLDDYYRNLNGMKLPDGTVLSKENMVLSMLPLKELQEYAKKIGAKTIPQRNGNAHYLPLTKEDGKHYVNFNPNPSYETTFANVRATAVHEFYGHGILGISGGKDHYNAYFLTIDSPYWKNTTESYRVSTAYGLWLAWTGAGKYGWKGMDVKYQRVVVNYHPDLN